jgi:hypothetical protein
MRCWWGHLAARGLGGAITNDRERTSPIAALFTRAFSRLDTLYRGFERDGVLLVAVRGDATIEAHLHVPVDVDPAFVVIGRHPRCDLVLDVDGTAAVRHAVLAARRVGLDEVRLRLWDLQTDTGIETETGDRCAGLQTDGHLFVRLGRTTLFCLPTGHTAPLPWGPTAAETWSCIPERIMRGVSPALRSRPARRPALLPGAGSVTLLTEGAEVLRLGQRPVDMAAPPIGRIRISTARAATECPVTGDDLARGLMLGRDDRCALMALIDQISRVHVLLVDEGGARWAVDVASTNGTAVGSEEVRQVRLGDRTELALAGEVFVRWSAQPPGSGRSSQRR